MAASLNQLLYEAVLELERITGQSIGNLQGASNYRLALYQVALLAAIPAGGAGTGDGGPAVDQQARDDLTALARRVTSLEAAAGSTGGGTGGTTGGGTTGGTSDYYLPAGATQIGSGPFYFDANGANTNTFGVPGAGRWSYVTDETEGEVLQSDVIADGSLATIRTRLVAEAFTQVSFRANISAELRYDYLVIEVSLVADNTSKDVYTLGSDATKPQNTWVAGTLNVPGPGVFELRLIYRKDASGAAGRDNARVGSVTLGEGLSYAAA